MKIRHCFSFALILASVAIAGCQSEESTTGSGTSTPAAAQNSADSSNAKAAQFNAEVDQALAELRKQTPGSDRLLQQAKGVLVFPNVYKAGFGVGGELGKGALRVNDQTVGYYNTTAASFGFQMGAQARMIVYMFMTDKALSDFRNSSNWSVGGNANVTLVKVGANGQIDAATVQQPVIAFVYGNTGLMYDLSLQGSKITKTEL